MVSNRWRLTMIETDLRCSYQESGFVVVLKLIYNNCLEEICKLIEAEFRLLVTNMCIDVNDD